jgi:hypothetical protein
MDLEDQIAHLEAGLGHLALGLGQHVDCSFGHVDPLFGPSSVPDQGLRLVHYLDFWSDLPLDSQPDHQMSHQMGRRLLHQSDLVPDFDFHAHWGFDQLRLPVWSVPDSALELDSAQSVLRQLNFSTCSGLNNYFSNQNSCLPLSLPNKRTLSWFYVC